MRDSKIKNSKDKSSLHSIESPLGAVKIGTNIDDMGIWLKDRLTSDDQEK
ncbi:hypothetical protein [Caldisalinibacter kiritimatiensis]|uniref:Uncharacterized protein n=1 Tax=Caldisalinibacter kiritimatiensis TaxID=1304284 RepID=R1AYM6_9FIRM|nr:hypothetical protein [Caldisalinibacter kiritimatiensis]EOD01807.1 hypothetical protein L21TH_0125 [Caldisalinibacter kiritimatiensis]